MKVDIVFSCRRVLTEALPNTMLDVEISDANLDDLVDSVGLATILDWISEDTCREHFGIEDD